MRKSKEKLLLDSHRAWAKQEGRKQTEFSKVYGRFLALYRFADGLKPRELSERSCVKLMKYFTHDKVGSRYVNPKKLEPIRNPANKSGSRSPHHHKKSTLN
jgi:hypothetical protein